MTAVPLHLLTLADQLDAYLRDGTFAGLGPVELQGETLASAELAVRITLADVGHCHWMAEVEQEPPTEARWRQLGEDLVCLSRFARAVSAPSGSGSLPEMEQASQEQASQPQPGTYELSKAFGKALVQHLFARSNGQIRRGRYLAFQSQDALARLRQSREKLSLPSHAR